MMNAFIPHSTGSPHLFERGYPVAGTTERAYDTADLYRAVEAFKFFYPAVGVSA